MRIIYIILFFCTISCEATTTAFAKLDSIEKTVVSYLDILDANHVYYDIDSRNAAFFYYTQRIAPEFIDSIMSPSIADSLVSCLAYCSFFRQTSEVFSTDYNILATDVVNLLYRLPKHQYASIMNNVNTHQIRNMVDNDVLHILSSASDYIYYPTYNVSEETYRSDVQNYCCYYVPFKGSNDTVIVSRGSTRRDSVVRVYDCEFFGMQTRLYFMVLDNQDNYKMRIRFKNSFSLIDNNQENRWANLSYKERETENLKLSANVSYQDFIEIFSFILKQISKDLDIRKLTEIDVRLAMLGDYAITTRLYSNTQNVKDYVASSNLVTDLEPMFAVYNKKIFSVNISDLCGMKKKHFLLENIVSDDLITRCPDNLYDGRIIINLMDVQVDGE